MDNLKQNIHVEHPYFYPKEFPDYELLTIDELNWRTSDGQKAFPMAVGERNGEVWKIGRFGSRLYLKRGNEATFKRILDLGIDGNPVSIFITDHPDENRCLVLTTNANKIYRSTDLNNDNYTSWELVQDTASSGLFSGRYGWSYNGKFILQATYGNKNEANPPRHLYLSRDYGETFKEIEILPISQMADPAHFHVHDVAFDPYANRIWVATGDQGNSNILYSDDWGDTFTKVYEDHSRTTQPTTIFPLPDRVIFGGDDRPNGIKVWKRNRFERKHPVKQEDIYVSYSPDDFKIHGWLRNVANLPQCDFNKLVNQYPYNLVLPFSSATGSNSPSRLLITPNGEDYFELWSTDKRDVTEMNASFTYVLPPMPSDEDRNIYALMYYPSAGTSFILKIKMPEWIETKGDTKVQFPKVQDVHVVERKREVLRDYSFTVSLAGVHCAGDTFVRGYGLDVLDVSSYKNITIGITNTSENTLLLETSRIRGFLETGYYSAITYFYESKVLNSILTNGIAAGSSVIITPDDVPILGENYLSGLVLYNVITSVGDSARIVVSGEQR